MENKEEKDVLLESFKKEVEKRAEKENLSKEEIKKATQEAMESINFLSKIEEIKLPTDKYVIFTDGEEQLFYENGEFYVISTTDSTKIKKKKTKKEATDMYLDYFIRYQLNPVLDQRDIKGQKLEIMKKKERQQKQEKVNIAEKIINDEVKDKNVDKAKDRNEDKEITL